MPRRKMAIAVAWWVALAVAWGDLSASILVVPPGVMTLPIRVFGLIHYGVDDQVAGISLCVMALFCVLALILGRIAHRAAARFPPPSSRTSLQWPGAAGPML